MEGRTKPCIQFPIGYGPTTPLRNPSEILGPSGPYDRAFCDAPQQEDYFRFVFVDSTEHMIAAHQDFIVGGFPIVAPT